MSFMPLDLLVKVNTSSVSLVHNNSDVPMYMYSSAHLSLKRKHP